MYITLPLLTIPINVFLLFFPYAFGTNSLYFRMLSKQRNRETGKRSIIQRKGSSSIVAVIHFMSSDKDLYTDITCIWCVSLVIGSFR